MWFNLPEIISLYLMDGNKVFIMLSSTHWRYKKYILIAISYFKGRPFDFKFEKKNVLEKCMCFFDFAVAPRMLNELPTYSERDQTTHSSNFGSSTYDDPSKNFSLYVWAFFGDFKVIWNVWWIFCFLYFLGLEFNGDFRVREFGSEKKIRDSV